MNIGIRPLNSLINKISVAKVVRYVSFVDIQGGLRDRVNLLRETIFMASRPSCSDGSLGPNSLLFLNKKYWKCPKRLVEKIFMLQHQREKGKYLLPRENFIGVAKHNSWLGISLGSFGYTKRYYTRLSLFRVKATDLFFIVVAAS